MRVDADDEVRLKADPRDYPDYRDADVHALRALARGEATSIQQKQALDYIINNVAGTYDIPLRTETNDTMAVIGKAIVGKHLVWLLKNAPTEKTSVEVAA